ncbi:MAG: BrnT family toxin [Selenomonadaceae bacterium]|nr:BrnT family toxin [Selenomonadaceae bacterium]
MSNVEFQSGELIFEWDSDKAALNWQKHKVHFEDAALVFADENRIERFDDEHSDDEDRYITIGRVKEILFVVYTERLDKTRLISARRATVEERRDYYAGDESY